MRICCPECGSYDVDAVFDVRKDPIDNYYYFVSKCNSCEHVGVNTTFWHGTGIVERVDPTKDSKVEKEVWEKKNI